MGVEIVPATASAPARRWKPYPAYRDSGVEWLGKVPEHWEVKKLKFVDEVIMGQSPNSEDYNKNGQGLPFLQGNAEFGDLNPIPIIWCETANKTATFGDVLLSVRAPVGAVNLADQKYGIGRGLCAIRAIKSNNKYLFYVCICLNDELNSIGTGSTYTAISVDDVKNVKYPFPMVEEQLSIASFLDRQTAHLGALISKKERLITLLEEKRAALISRAVTKGLDPNAPMKDSGVEWLGEVPEHWKISKFRRICRLQQGLQMAQANRFADPGHNRFEYITIKSIHAGDASNSKEYIENPPQSVICVPDEILLARTGATGEVISGQNGVFHNNFFKVIYDRNLVDKNFLIYYLSNTQIKEHLVLLAGTTTIPDLNHGEFLDTPFLSPAIDEQKAIVSYLARETSKLDAIIARIYEGIEKLREYRNALISAAVTGRIDVREAVG